MTANAGDAAIAPYRGNTLYSGAGQMGLLCFEPEHGLEIRRGFSLSDANYSQDNFATGLPLGIEYFNVAESKSASLKIVGKNISAKLQYRYDYYEEPSSGGSDNFRANSIFGVVTFRSGKLTFDRRQRKSDLLEWK